MAKINISKFKECYGCGVCVSVCPVKIISYGENKNGFYEPNIQNQDECINCGLCLTVCAYNHSLIGQSINKDHIHSHAGWAKDKQVLESSSSGGIAYELSKWGLSAGYKICGAIYNPKTSRVEHKIINSLHELNKLQGSKYIPSDTVDAFRKLKKGEKYMIFGTPCQIDSLRHKVNKFNQQENYILIDFFCHGVPSLLMWDEYLKHVIPHTGSMPMVYWRNKVFGWHGSYRFIIKGESSEYVSPPQSDNIYYNLFLNNYVLNECCYESCKYKQLSSSADIRLGDFWGDKYASNNLGVSCIISFTNRGKEILEHLTTTCNLETVETNEATHAQMKTNAKRPVVQKLVLYALKHKWTLDMIYQTIVVPYKYLISYPKRIVAKLFHLTSGIK